MTTPLGAHAPEYNNKFFESLQTDLKALCAETKKKYPQIKEVGFIGLLGLDKV